MPGVYARMSHRLSVEFDIGIGIMVVAKLAEVVCSMSTLFSFGQIYRISFVRKLQAS
jgi:hypothetical protein